MKLIPILTEKSLNEAKNGKYTFLVPSGLGKFQIKTLVESQFKVNVVSIKTINQKGEEKRNNRGKKRIIMSTKKALVSLAEKQKIDLFDEGK